MNNQITYKQNAMHDFSAICEFFNLTESKQTPENFQLLTSDVTSLIVHTHCDPDPDAEISVQTQVLDGPCNVLSDASLTGVLTLCDTRCDIYQKSKFVMSINAEPNNLIVLPTHTQMSHHNSGLILIIKISDILSRIGTGYGISKS